MSNDELVKVIATEHNLPDETVRKVLNAFKAWVIEITTQGESVKVSGLGTFFMKEKKARGVPSTKGRRSGLYFKMTKKESVMEKYAVVLDPDKTKTSSTKPTCPLCGAELDGPNHCPKCGTKGFEKKEGT